jgi:GAF domain-containing protein
VIAAFLTHLALRGSPDSWHKNLLVTFPLVLAAGALSLLFVRSRIRLESMIAALERQVDEANQQKTAEIDNIARLYEASQATSQEAEPGGIMDTLAEDARQIVGSESASVAIFIEKDLLASVTKGISSDFKRNLRWRVRKGGMTEKILSTGKPLVTNSARTDPLASESSAVRLGGQQSIMAVPLVSENTVFGVLYLGDSRPERFTDHDLMLASILANHAAASIRQTRLHRELGQKLEDLESAHRELVGADRLKTEFISTVTSEMRVPLDAIRTYSQTLLQRADDDSFKLKRKFLGAVVEESMKLLSTVNGVIDLSRMEFGEGDLRREPVKIENVVKDVCGILEPLCVERGVDIAVDIPKDTGPAYLDKDMIFLLFRNLIEAATSFARPSTPVRLAIGEDDEFIEIKIRLTPSTSALGMEGAIRAIWGNEFIPPDVGSIGLVLQVCRNIVLRHGGRIWSETHDQGQWSFVVLFGKERRPIVPSELTFEIVASRPELKRMLALVADMISRVLGVSACHIYLEDPATASLALQATTDSGRADRMGLRVAKGQGLAGRAYEQASPIVLNSPGRDADGNGRSAAVPIRMEGRAVGVVTVAEKTTGGDVFDEGDIGLLAAIADRISVALERTTSYESARDQFVSVMTALRTILEARRLPSVNPRGADAGERPTVERERTEVVGEAERRVC